MQLFSGILSTIQATTLAAEAADSIFPPYRVREWVNYWVQVGFAIHPNPSFKPPISAHISIPISLLFPPPSIQHHTTL
ncbi:hypothetical protein PIB30_059221 [Stylosanthes scabra]|uniref:Uncharacterized protein n=1 Tax=Stylosanthes scabra TaxID=79078 RepID=A0ABU6RKI9_9FABA|nr:hypothetical protein [Stylosanthes scabra]